MEEIRLALFTDTYAPEINGVAKTLERWVTFLRRRGVVCQVFAPARPRGEGPPPDVAERLRSVPFFLYPELRLASPRSFAAERKLLAFRPTVIHVATPFGVGMAGRHLALKHGIPLVASHHTHFVRYLPFYNLQWMGKLLWRYLHWFHRPCRRIYVPSRSVLEECAKDGWQGLEVWSRAIDTTVFHPDGDAASWRARHGIAEDRFLVLCAGRLAPEKQPELAVEAAARFAERIAARREASSASSREGRSEKQPSLAGARLIPSQGLDADSGIELVFAGDGPAANDVRALAAKRGVKTRMLGAIPQAELQRWMAASDAMLFPSPTETFGNVVLEAMACGLPVVGAAAGAVPDTVRDGVTGLLCEAGDADAFADALLRLRTDDGLRAVLSAAGLADARARSWDEVFGRLLASVTEAAVDPRIRAGGAVV